MLRINPSCTESRRKEVMESRKKRLSGLNVKVPKDSSLGKPISPEKSKEGNK